METSTSPLVENRGLPLDVVRHVLAHLGDTRYGVQAGSFVQRLLATITAADEGNRALMRKAFPDYVAAMDLYRAEGFEALRAIAEAAEL